MNLHLHLVLAFLILTLYFLLGFAGLAPLASHFFSAAKKSNQKMPPALFALRVPELRAVAYGPVLMRRPGAQD